MCWSSLKVFKKKFRVNNESLILLGSVKFDLIVVILFSNSLINPVNVSSKVLDSFEKIFSTYPSLLFPKNENNNKIFV